MRLDICAIASELKVPSMVLLAKSVLVIVILAVFFVLVGVWSYVAYRLTRQRAIANILTRYSQALVPFILIGLGIFILIDSGTYRLLPLYPSR